ncbi:hypothetical protein [Bacillus cereus group sp. BfR-BA-01380]|uniref:hypothetical protein n=1 Tax=Bacillus cereus group sp. BfR-BA-01380 TaxID=2920324 RepID=UPI001F5805EF|nr:hypothetical protein [Bacillus cereus group sp. BfR-BA-01380]
MTTIVVRPEQLIDLSKSFIQYAEEVQRLEHQLERNYQSIPWSIKAKSFVDQQWYEAKRQMGESMHHAHNLARSLERAAEKFARADEQELAGTVPTGANQKAAKKEEQGFWDKMMGGAKKFVDDATDKVKELAGEVGDAANKAVDYVKDPDGLLSFVSTWGGKISAITGTLALLTVWCPPLAGALGAVSTVTGGAGLLADAKLYAMGKKDLTAVALDAVGTLPGVGGVVKGLKGIKELKPLFTSLKGEGSLSHWINRDVCDGEAEQMAKSIFNGTFTSAAGWQGVYRNGTPE